MAIGIDESNLVSGVSPFLSEKPIIFDVGSNKADWSDIILNEFGENCTIYLFEPNKMLLDYSRIKYEYKSNIIYNELAAYSYDGIAQFYYFENFNNELSSLYKQNWDGEMPMKKGVVTTVKIDTYCEVNGIGYIDYLKIDAKGSDVDVVMGAMEMMKADKIRFVQIEYGEHYNAANKTFKDVIETVNSWGYKVYSYDVETNNYTEVSRETFIEDYHYENYLITKEAIFTHSSMGFNSRFVEITEGLPKFDLIIEIGSFEGVTTKYMAENMLSEGGRVIAIDPMNDYYVNDDPRYHPEFRGQYQRFKRHTKGLPVELMKGKSEDEFPKIAGLRADFIYIDGNHYAPFPYFDGCWAFAVTKIGGYCLWDDYDTWAVETKASIDKFLEEYKGSYEIVKQGYQILIKKTQDWFNEVTENYYK